MAELFRANYGIGQSQTVVVTEETITLENGISGHTEVLSRSAIAEVETSGEHKPGLFNKCGNFNLDIRLVGTRRDGYFVQRGVEVHGLSYEEGQRLLAVLRG